MEETTVNLKLLVDTKSNKVLFAEASKEFVDFLLHVLSLPIATAIKLLTTNGMVGCLGDLYKSIEALNNDYFQPNVKKAKLLNPNATVSVPLLLLNDAPAPIYPQKNFYKCSNCYSCNYVADNPGAVCPGCKCTMHVKITFVPSKSSSTADVAPPSTGSSASSGGFVKGVVTYMVMDNLEVKPMSTISGITLINKFQVKDVASLVEKEVQVGLNEALAMLKASLESQAVLTAVFLSNKLLPFQNMNMEVEAANYKFSLQLLVDTSSNKVLYAEANKDFVDFLFSMLSLPIATIINLLKTTANHGDDEMVGCIGNLYKSIEALDSNYMQPNITKDSILNPTTARPPNLFLLNHPSPPSNKSTTKKFYTCSNSTSMASASASNSSPAFSFPNTNPLFSSSPWGAFGVSGSKSCNHVSDVPSTVCPSCRRVMSRELTFIASGSSKSVDMASPSSSGYVKGLATYMVMDNLEVTPLSTRSTVSLFKSHARDVASFLWKHVQVGPNEGVKILKASLVTQAVLTTVFLERGRLFHGGVVTCMVTDNLEVKSMFAISDVTLINKLHVKDVDFTKIMGEDTNQKLTLKLLVGTRANKVLFAETGKDFVDFLFYIMLLPIGTIVKLLKMKDDKMQVGCLGDLYKSIEALSTDYVQSNMIKDAVLKPTSSSAFVPPPNTTALLLKDALASHTGTSRKFYLCPYNSHNYVSDAQGAVCPSCNSTMSREFSYVAPKSSSSSRTSGYVKGKVTYMVMDNLEVKPMSAISTLSLINKFHVKDVTSLAEKHIEVGFDEGMKILKALLESQAIETVTDGRGDDHFEAPTRYKGLEKDERRQGTCSHVRCLSNLYRSIEAFRTEAFGTDHVHHNVAQDRVLKPISSMHVAPPNSPVLKDVLAVGTMKFYLHTSYPSSHYVSDALGTPCPSCRLVAARCLVRLTMLLRKALKGIHLLLVVVYNNVKGVVTYMVTDNFQVKPMSAISAVALTDKLHVKDVVSLVEKDAEVGFDESMIPIIVDLGMRILKIALESRAM
ncbi:hypothetical protein Cgig2_002190 [Carnegiea gigantea]|uniref:Uncharacterized protein n=1 Tax=Carnegiea gigantea TaxID=171969 RepID=A0A9Q1KWR9_9CARY|nr:hypothetical protein Cgig2_002190 [Carnegiea gigantea]